MHDMKSVSQAPIGVFDSGVGGLTVVKEIMNQIPGESIVYFGDTARVPYGNKSKATIIRYTRQIVKFLQAQQVKAIVIACNTATAFALEAVSQEIDIPIIGVIQPGAEMAARTTKNGHIGVLGTEGTVQSRVYNDYIRSIDDQLRVFGKACPLFVPLVEEGWIEDPVTMEVVRRYINELMPFDIDTLVMGCTHYPLLRSTIQKVAGDKVQLVNPALETAKSLKELLKEQGILNETGIVRHRFYVSDGAEKFSKFANSILPCEVVETTGVDIESLADGRFECMSEREA